jgi:hypothetical protein
MQSASKASQARKPLQSRCMQSRTFSARCTESQRMRARAYGQKLAQPCFVSTHFARMPSRILTEVRIQNAIWQDLWGDLDRRYSHNMSAFDSRGGSGIRSSQRPRSALSESSPSTRNKYELQATHLSSKGGYLEKHPDDPVGPSFNGSTSAQLYHGQSRLINGKHVYMRQSHDEEDEQLWESLSSVIDTGLAFLQGGYYQR